MVAISILISAICLDGQNKANRSVTSEPSVFWIGFKPSTIEYRGADKFLARPD